MINSAKTVLEFGLSNKPPTDSINSDIFSSNGSSGTQTSLISQTRVYHRSPKNTFKLFFPSSTSVVHQELIGASPLPSETRVIFVEKSGLREKVKVQHLQTHTKLQNNRWNYQNFYGLNSAVLDSLGAQNIFKTKDLMWESGSTKFEHAVMDQSSNTNNHDLCLDQNLLENSDTKATYTNRTQDQENAFRRIEDVHNYAKLNHYGYSNCSSDSSCKDDDIEEDDDEEEVNEMDEGTEDYNMQESNYETFWKNNKPNSTNASTSSRNIAIRSTAKDDDSETHVDVESVPSEDQLASFAGCEKTPDHHARRPMNAFLIFCKRHRAIVKERYKTLENRAITKILGDWWASLEPCDKKCFTNLAQQNKDAFFSANPNFKWYKLPAPPLRTLSTRPSNLFDRHNDSDLKISKEQCGNLTPTRENDGNFFKLADEAQMGDLSSLMSNNSLQKALGETSQYISQHIGSSSSPFNMEVSGNMSNSSDDGETTNRKNSRSCKGKIYQKLMTSGQISVIAKKSKQSKTASQQNPEFGEKMFDDSGTEFSQHQKSVSNTQCLNNETLMAPSESNHHCDNIVPFDLEERIKELPALNLDAYLQRKRICKKKKKLNHKKRSHEGKQKGTFNKPDAAKSSTAIPSNAINNKKSPTTPKPTVAVGSQKRKARKESITRRDVSAIAEEIASIIPLSNAEFTNVNGCYFFSTDSGVVLSPTSSPNSTYISNSTSSPTTIGSTEDTPNARCNAQQTFLLSNNINNSNSLEMLTAAGGETKQGIFQNDNDISNNNISSSTSDLLILAEVAANRTELSN